MVARQAGQKLRNFVIDKECSQRMGSSRKEGADQMLGMRHATNTKYNAVTILLNFDRDYVGALLAVH